MGSDELERDDTGGESVETDEGTWGDEERERGVRRKRESEKGICGTVAEKILLSTRIRYTKILHSSNANYVLSRTIVQQRGPRASAERKKTCADVEAAARGTVEF